MDRFSRIDGGIRDTQKKENLMDGGEMREWPDEWSNQRQRNGELPPLYIFVLGVSESCDGARAKSPVVPNLHFRLVFHSSALNIGFSELLLDTCGAFIKYIIFKVGISYY